MQQAQSQFDPGFAAFGGGVNSTVLHPLVAVLLIVLTVLIFWLPRRQIIVPLLLGILLIPAGQGFYLAGVHLYVSRLLILTGLTRVLFSKPSTGRFLPGGFITLDKIFLVWAIYRVLAMLLQYMAIGAVVNQAGFLLDSVGGYFLFRSLIRDTKDIPRVISTFVVVTAVCACGMLIENRTGQNLFGHLGGIKLLSDVRNGRIRAQGAFQHSILAGTFAATVFPLFILLWKTGKAKLTAAIGCVSAFIMIFTCASSTPVGAWVGGSWRSAFGPSAIS